MIKVNGTAIPTPTEYRPGIMDISKAERNARGDMVIDRITTKRKLELSWNYLSQEQLSHLLQLVSPVFVTVEYPDAQEGAMRTGTFYTGDRVPAAAKYQDGVMSWKDFKLSLIEK